MADPHAYDLVVIGSGPSGRRAAIQAAKFGRSVLVIDRQARVGGVSVHSGTIPSKTLRETVLNLTGWRERGFYGMAYRVKTDIDADDLRARLAKTLDYEVDVLDHQFSRNGVAVQRGLAHFVDGHRIGILTPAGDTRTVSADKVVIAVGTRPHRPAHVPFDDSIVLDSDGIISLDRLPRALTVVGGGVIGIEYATIFSALDVRVTLIESRDSILDFVDREVIAGFMHQLRDHGMNFRLGTRLEAIRIESGQPVAMLEGGQRVRADMLLYTGGRAGATDQLNLAACGLQADTRGRLKVDPKTFQTAVPHIYATGDVIGFPSLASTSLEQGRIAACHAFQQHVPPAPEFFPYGIYSVPEISTVGMSEEDARARGVPYECGIARFRETSRGNIMGLRGGMLKLVIALDTRRLLGVHIMGEGATELIHIGQAVLNLGGTLDYFLDATFNYPTLAEAYKVAAFDAWNRITPRDTCGPSEPPPPDPPGAAP
ncbi:Si-specific NAD(P)(+) transhydrogenase [Gluconacetobacter azotocaptans]|uniref:Soluble pyridine nucleotide transhydrogenase n=1 Tax=Gluconacetobacter azotocaptans TaxID=142834 RepID=A0A7W4JUN4_9PROT|nr:Si-specific NAD(P)(+) transhydrogenase [Gluconacetobacter azotocaptans]MBB2191256.1 Si-specific NAD(P)(+) transhydrogenase [Gluconacetobacter azotocaptans]GBQ25762.1 dihydrolipoamide dehydrogenase [Gluconacetobacter azotocaptans DSM 13594]